MATETARAASASAMPHAEMPMERRVPADAFQPAKLLTLLPSMRTASSNTATHEDKP